MAWNYRKRVKIAPGVTINISKSGVSTTIGPKGANVNIGSRGTYINTGIPGTGLYNRQKIGGSRDSSSNVNRAAGDGNGGCMIVLFIFLFIFLCFGFSINNSLMSIVAGILLFILIVYTTLMLNSSKGGKATSNDGIMGEADDKSTCNDSNVQDNVETGEKSYDLAEPFLGIYDPLLEDAVMLLLQNGGASMSMLQRKFSIGYNRAGRLMNQLEELGVVGPAVGASPRELLIHTDDDWLILKSNILINLSKRLKSEDGNLLQESSSQKVTEEQYNLIKTESNNLCSFVTKVVKRKNVKAKLDEMFQLENSDGTPWTISEKTKLAIITDIYRCYKGLGHNFSLDDDDENLGIYLFMGKYLTPDVDLPYNALPNFKSRLKDSFVGVFETSELLDKNAKIAPNEFFLQKVLGECDRELQIQYMSLLYRFASAVAKADGNINETEERWLADIMKSKDLNIGNGSNVRTTTEQAPTSVESPYEKLNSLIGLNAVKEDITKLANFIKIQQVRQAKGLKAPEISYHCVFTGNPGTGKTTVARIMASIYKELGILKKGHLVETDRSGLVAEYVGQTAVKTNKIIDSALDGVLFIDEAYSLVQGSKEDFGQEAISTLLKRMEDDRNRLVVILAGYSSEMKDFIDSNPGLQSRFNRYINFSDYDANDLEKIFLLNADKNQYVLNEAAIAKVKEIMVCAIEHKDKNFGNARFVRNLFEKSIQNQAMRLSPQSKITAEELSMLKAEDIPNN